MQKEKFCKKLRQNILQWMQQMKSTYLLHAHVNQFLYGKWGRGTKTVFIFYDYKIWPRNNILHLKKI